MRLKQFLQKGDLVELIETDPGADYVYCSKHTNPKMLNYILSSHHKKIFISEILKWGEENGINIHNQMQARKIKPGTIGMVLSSFFHVDDQGADAAKGEKTLGGFGYCLLVGDEYLVVQDHKTKFIKSSVGTEPNTTPFLGAQK